MQIYPVGICSGASSSSLLLLIVSRHCRLSADGEVLLIELGKLVHRLYWVARRKDEVEDIKFIFGISINDTAHPSRNVMAE